MRKTVCGIGIVVVVCLCVGGAEASRQGDAVDKECTSACHSAYFRCDIVCDGLDFPASAICSKGCQRKLGDCLRKCGVDIPDEEPGGNTETSCSCPAFQCGILFGKSCSVSCSSPKSASCRCGGCNGIYVVENSCSCR